MYNVYLNKTWYPQRDTHTHTQCIFSHTWCIWAQSNHSSLPSIIPLQYWYGNIGTATLLLSSHLSHNASLMRHQLNPSPNHRCVWSLPCVFPLCLYHVCAHTRAIMQMLSECWQGEEETGFIQSSVPESWVSDSSLGTFGVCFFCADVKRARKTYIVMSRLVIVFGLLLQLWLSFLLTWQSEQGRTENRSQKDSRPSRPMFTSSNKGLG